MSSVFETDNRWRSANRLLLILGDQLDRQHPGLSEIDPDSDVILMAEVREEAEHAPSHRQRTTLFLAAMRHHAQWLQQRNYRVRYITLDDPANTQSLGGELTRALDILGPSEVLLMRPGEHRVANAISTCCETNNLALRLTDNPAFTCSLETFSAWAAARKTLVMEHFYRARRRELDILMDSDGQPTGGQ